MSNKNKQIVKVTGNRGWLTLALLVILIAGLGAGTVLERNVRDILKKTNISFGGINLDDGVTDSPSLTLTDASDETLVIIKTDGDDATFTIAAANAINIVGGSVAIGNGTPATAQDGEDLYVEGLSEFASNMTLDDGVTNSPSLIFKDGDDVTATLLKLDDADVTFTPGTTTESLRIVSGCFRVGDGTADVALDDEDAYVEGTFEVDDAVRLDGPIDANSTLNVQGATTLQAALIRTSQEYSFGPGALVGASAGWLTSETNVLQYRLPASESTTATLVIPVSGLHVGDTITGWKFVGQAESAGNTCEIEADLRKITTVAAGNSDASVGAIAGLKLTADTAIASEVTDLSEVVAANESFYVLVSATTAASTDFDIQGGTITMTTN